MRSCGVAELITCHFQRMDGSKRNQCHDALEMLPITSDAGPQSNDIAAIRLWRLRARSDKSRPAAWFQHGEGPLRDLSADSIEGGVAVSHDLGKINRIVVDDLIGADFAQITVVR